MKLRKIIFFIIIIGTCFTGWKLGGWYFRYLIVTVAKQSSKQDPEIRILMCILGALLGIALPITYTYWNTNAAGNIRYGASYVVCLVSIIGGGLGIMIVLNCQMERITKEMGHIRKDRENIIKELECIKEDREKGIQQIKHIEKDKEAIIDVLRNENKKPPIIIYSIACLSWIEFFLFVIRIRSHAPINRTIGQSECIAAFFSFTIGSAALYKIYLIHYISSTLEPIKPSTSPTKKTTQLIRKEGTRRGKEEGIYPQQYF